MPVPRWQFITLASAVLFPSTVAGECCGAVAQRMTPFYAPPKHKRRHDPRL